MALIKIAARAHADLRFDRLAKVTGLPTRWDALGRMIPIWNACTESGNPLIEKDVCDLLFGCADVADKIVRVGLGFDDENAIRIAGYDEHCAWLNVTREAGKTGGKHGFKGGRPSTKSKAKEGVKAKTPRGVTKVNPSTVINYQLSVISNSGSLNSELVEAAGPAELALACLAKITGVGYGSSKKHQALVTARIADGIPLADLIRIAEFCAYGKAWRGDSKMHGYLRPETLWGSDSHAKYLDAARAWDGRLVAPPSSTRDIRYGSAPPNDFAGIAPGEYEL